MVENTMRFCCMTYPTDALDMREKYLLPNIIEKLSYYLTVQQDNQTTNEDIVHNPISEIQYLYDRISLYDVSVSLKPEVDLCKVLENLCYKENQHIHILMA